MSNSVRVKWDNRPALAAAEEGGASGLEMASRVVMAMANAHAPLESGALIGSANVDWDGTTATVYYDTVYAARLHQNPEFHFANGRQGRWLAVAAMKSRAEVLQYFAKALRVRFSRAH